MKHHGIISQFPDIFINGRDGFAVNYLVTAPDRRIRKAQRNRILRRGRAGSRTRLRRLTTPAVTALTTVQRRDQIRRKIPAGYAGITGGKRIANRLSR